MFTRSRLVLLLLLIVGGGVAWGVFLWTMARVEVEPDTFLVVTNRWGEALPPGELVAKVKPECEKLGIVIDYIAVGQTRMNPTLDELAGQIREREQARITRSTNQQKVAQYEREQVLKSTEKLAEREKLLIDANTRLEQAKIEAERQVNNQKAELDAQLAAAEARLEGSRKKAEAVLTTGKAKAAVIVAQNEAEVAGLRTAIEGFGTAEAFAQYHILLKVSPVLSDIFASDDSEFAQLFSHYLAASPPASRTAVAPPPRDKGADGTPVGIPAASP